MMKIPKEWERDINRYDIISDKLWDSVSFAPGATWTRHNSYLFTNCIGVNNKTYVDTNLEQASQLPFPEEFAIIAIRFTFSKFNLERDIYTIAENQVFSLWLGNKRYAHNLLSHLDMGDVEVAPFYTCTFCKSVFCNIDRCPNCGAQQFEIFNEISENRITLGKQFSLIFSRPLIILSQLYFKIDFNGEDITLISAEHGGTGIKMWCHFEGLRRRGVQ